MTRNLIHILYGVPGIAANILTVVSMISIRRQLSSTFMAIFLLTAVTNLITYINTWLTIRLREEKWFFGYYEEINKTVVIPYIHQYLVGFLYFAQNINATLLTMDRFFAIAALGWKEVWTRYFGLFTLFCYVFCAILHFFASGFYDINRVNAFVYDSVTDSYALKMKDMSNVPVSVCSQVFFGALILICCSILNIVSLYSLKRSQWASKTVKTLERSFFLISFCIFLAQSLNIMILAKISAVMAFTSDLFSLGPGIYTLLLPGPIRKKCVAILSCKKIQVENSFSLTKKLVIRSSMHSY